MKNFAKRVSALVLALVVGAAALCPAALAAASLPDLPKDECVVDDANILSDSTTQTIVDLNNQLQSSCNGAQIGVLTVDYTGNYSTEDYATQAFNAWGTGSASENNGVLILLVMESPIYEDGDYYVTYGDGFRNTTVVSVQHDGSDPNMPISSCFLKLTLETRDAEQIEQIRAELAKEGFQLVSERV